MCVFANMCLWFVCAVCVRSCVGDLCVSVLTVGCVCACSAVVWGYMLLLSVVRCCGCENMGLCVVLWCMCSRVCWYTDTTRHHIEHKQTQYKHTTLITSHAPHTTQPCVQLNLDTHIHNDTDSRTYTHTSTHKQVHINTITDTRKIRIKHTHEHIWTTRHTYMWTNTSGHQQPHVPPQKKCNTKTEEKRKEPIHEPRDTRGGAFPHLLSLLFFSLIKISIRMWYRYVFGKNISISACASRSLSLSRSSLLFVVLSYSSSRHGSVKECNSCSNLGE